jgi:secernin
MCDTLCVPGPQGLLFAKNSDRPPGEAQVLEAHPPRSAGGRLRTQYLEIPDEGAMEVVLSRPVWLWGAEHGVSVGRVAVGNEKVYTVDDPYEAPQALIGMDIVRLVLERARSAEEGVERIASLLARYGQGGVADQAAKEPYFSSFLVADPMEAWVVETSGSRWAAKRIGPAAAISNRLILHDDWDRAGPDVAPGTDVSSWRNPDAPVGHAEVRLAASRRLIESVRERGVATPALMAAHLRDHGTGPWGAPGPLPGGLELPELAAPPEVALPDGTGVTVCMHVRGYQATTASMVAELPGDPEAPLRAWVALGSPCASIFVPVFPGRLVPGELADPATWTLFATLRDAVERDGSALEAVRGVLDPIERELWEESDAVAADPERAHRYATTAGRRVVHAAKEALAFVDAAGAIG